MNPLVSIIVPIYNVVPYIQKCLDSLKRQTLKEIEVIMIDDGSTDESGKFAEEYTSDCRFQCIHTENRGLSAARNKGIEESRADYIMFVDSDDWVDEQFCEKPYKVAIENNADIVIFQHYAVSAGGKTRRDKTQGTVITGSVNKETAMGIEGIVVWRKIYRRKLFDNICFPEGLINEDILTTHKLIYAAERIYSIPDKLYYYRKRRGSISHSKNRRYETSEFGAMLQRCNDLIAFRYPEDKAIRQLQISALRHCGKSPNTNDELYKIASGIAESISGIPNDFNMRQKIMLFVWRANQRLFRLLYWVTGKRQSISMNKG